MAYQRSIVALAALVLMAVAAFATGNPQGKTAAIALAGPAIISAFDGKTVSGYYADGTPVRETYYAGGGITYWDPDNGQVKGTWSVVNNLFCTFYNGMNGGCFRVEKLGANCFDFFAVAGSAEEALQPGQRQDYTARAFVEGAPSSCPDELSV